MMMMLTVMILEKKIKIGKDDGGGYDYNIFGDCPYILNCKNIFADTYQWKLL